MKFNTKIIRKYAHPFIIHNISKVGLDLLLLKRTKILVKLSFGLVKLLPLMLHIYQIFRKFFSGV